MSVKHKILVAFDFDHTIIDGNSDTYVSKLCEGGQVPQHIKDTFSLDSWTFYMAAIFDHLHKQGITAEDLKRCISELPLVKGFEELLQYLSSENFDVIIISDSNSVFIDYALENVNMKQIVESVYTNPAHYDEKGCLKIEYYHTQDWCGLSTINLCKGHILEEHIKRKREKENVEYQQLIYVGDGTNDFCPALRLSGNDYVCARKGLSLWKKLKKLGLLDEKKTKFDLKAKILVWETGDDILKLLKELPQMNIESAAAKN